MKEFQVEIVIMKVIIIKREEKVQMILIKNLMVQIHLVREEVQKNLFIKTILFCKRILYHKPQIKYNCKLQCCHQIVLVITEKDQYKDHLIQL